MGATAAISTFAIGGVSSAMSENAAGKFNQIQAKHNARIADLQAEDAILRGRDDERLFRRQTDVLIGAQRTSLAAQGIEIDSGTALRIQEDTAALGELDALTIRNNARREAWGYQVQAGDQRLRGDIARAEGRNRAMSTLLGTGTGVISRSHGRDIFGRDRGRSTFSGADGIYAAGLVQPYSSAGRG